MGVNPKYWEGLSCPYCNSKADKARATAELAEQDKTLGSTIEWYSDSDGCKKTFIVVRGSSPKGGDIMGVFKRPEDWQQPPERIPAEI